ncbi:MAG TPA: nucleoside-diphosphate kinase [Candidatus Dormibacteraeota bacterium]
MSDALVIFKPDSAHRLAARAGLWSWLASERAWKIEAITWYQPPAELIESHYDFLQGRPFFPWLVDFMTALPVAVGRLSAEPAALEQMRYELGETRIAESRPGSLRERFGIFGGCNCLHLSDSPETGGREVEMWSRWCDLSGGSKVDLTPDGDRPDHTYQLRSLATQINGGRHLELAITEVKRLLKEESELEGEEFAALSRVVLGAFT